MKKQTNNDTFLKMFEEQIKSNPVLAEQAYVICSKYLNVSISNTKPRKQFTKNHYASNWKDIVKIGYASGLSVSKILQKVQENQIHNNLKRLAYPRQCENSIKRMIRDL